jgi:hypothetical protein
VLSQDLPARSEMIHENFVQDSYQIFPIANEKLLHDLKMEAFFTVSCQSRTA